MWGMFHMSKFNHDISKWDVSKAKTLQSMFEEAKFNHDISNWKINENCLTFNMFEKCVIKNNF